jgi:hypothetical protein
MEPASADAALAARERVQRLARWLDEGLRVPGTGWRVGIESLIGLLPVAGDAIGLLLSLWIIVEARRAGAPARLLWRMAGNAALDAGAGALPLVGDLFDFWFRANARNAELLRQHFELQRPEPAARRRSWIALAMCLTFLAAWWWWCAAR